MKNLKKFQLKKEQLKKIHGGRFRCSAVRGNVMKVRHFDGPAIKGAWDNMMSTFGWDVICSDSSHHLV